MPAAGTRGGAHQGLHTRAVPLPPVSGSLLCAGKTHLPETSAQTPWRRSQLPSGSGVVGPRRGREEGSPGGRNRTEAGKADVQCGQSGFHGRQTSPALTEASGEQQPESRKSGADPPRLGHGLEGRRPSPRQSRWPLTPTVTVTPGQAGAATPPRLSILCFSALSDFLNCASGEGPDRGPRLVLTVPADQSRRPRKAGAPGNAAGVWSGPSWEDTSWEQGQKDGRDSRKTQRREVKTRRASSGTRKGRFVPADSLFAEKFEPTWLLSLADPPDAPKRKPRVR